MKLLFVSSGYPPAESDAGELCVAALARAAVQRGHAALVVAPARERAPEGVCMASEERGGDGVALVRIAREDLHSRHWQKSTHPGVTRLFRELLRRERPALVHLHHWRGLSRDLVHAAALERVPAIVSLHDPWTSCLIGTRVLPDTGHACAVPLAAQPCLGCAQKVPPRTSWVPREAQYMLLAERSADLAREVDLARVRCASSAAAADSLRTWLGRDPTWPIEIVAADFGAHLPLYERALAAGAPEVLPGADWYRERMRAFAIEQWDRGALAAGERGA